MGTVNQEKQLERIADALESIVQELGSMNVHLSSMDDLAECVDDSKTMGPRLCITGSILTSEDY